MKVFRELNILGDAEQIGKLIGETTASPSEGWSRDSEAEKEMNAFEPDPKLICFSCDERNGRQAARLWLAAGPTSARVSNVVPTKKQQLTREEYNAIVEDFFRRFVARISSDMGLIAEIGKDDETLEDWINDRVASKLRFFSEQANKSTGASHPNDEQRWYEFIVAAHTRDSRLDASMLQRWLVEEGGWSGDVASDLAREYESARSLLEFYDKKRK